MAAQLLIMVGAVAPRMPETVLSFTEPLIHEPPPLGLGLAAPR